MFRRGGVTPFLFGLNSRVARDVLFGALYSGLRQQGKDQMPTGCDETVWEIIVNTFAATAATIASGPFNYVQNKQYATSSKKEQPSIASTLRQLIRDTYHQKGGIQAQLSFLQQRLRIGKFPCYTHICSHISLTLAVFHIRVGNNSSGRRHGLWQFCL